ncbi:MAG: hypothetical protein WCJ30_16035, partial [Deltaproteobacteria bacterium]
FARLSVFRGGATLEAIEEVCDEPLALDRIAESLLERETLDSEEIQACIDGRPLPHRTKVNIPSWSERRDKRGDAGRGTPAAAKTASIFPPRRTEPTGA